MNAITPTHLMLPAPRIKRPQVEANVHLDDLWAGRIVDQMLAALDHDRNAGFEAFTKLVESHQYNLGNPKGQQRLLGALCRSFGAGLLDSYAQFGKRKRFTIHVDEALAVESGLLGQSLRIVGVGPNRNLDVGCCPCVFFTRHALVRLVQRCNCRSAADLTSALRSVWATMLYVLIVSEFGARLPEGKRGWILPAKTIAGPLVGVPLVQGVLGEHPAPLVVPTVLSPSMVCQSALRPIAALFETIGDNDEEIDDATLETLRTLLEASPGAQNLNHES